MEGTFKKSNFRKGFERILASGIIFFGSLIGSAKAINTLKVYNVINSSEPVLRVQHREGALESPYDRYDRNKEFELEFLPEGYPEIYSDVNSVRLGLDARSLGSNTPFNLKLVYKRDVGVGSSLDNYFRFAFGSETFDNKPIIFQQTTSTDPNAFYPVYDVRRAIAQNEGKVPLEKLVAGSYSPDAPYGSGILTIGTRLLADIKNEEDGLVNLVDYAVLANEWGKSDVNSIADISGPDGISDRKVNFYDLKAFGDDYLRDINEPGTW